MGDRPPCFLWSLTPDGARRGQTGFIRSYILLARNPLSFSSDDFVPGMLRAMGDIFPQKVAYVGHEAIEKLIDEAIEAARSFQLLTVRGIALMVVLMFAFGHGCCNDPLYPWIERTLTDLAITDAVARAKRLEQKALTWLDHVLERKNQAGN